MLKFSTAERELLRYKFFIYNSPESKIRCS